MKLNALTSATFNHHDLCNAVNITKHSCEWPIVVGYDGIEGYMPIFKLFVSVAASLHDIRDLMKINALTSATFNHNDL